jgi:protein TonB
VSGTPAREAPASVAEEVIEARAAEPDAAEPTAEAGAPGGISWGVPGGVVGGIVGGVSEAAAPAAPVRVGDGIKEPVKLKHVPPVYPDIAARANVQGAVVLDCTVSPQGRVTAVTVVRGVPLLNEAAISAVRQWIYTPTLKDGAPVPVLMTVTVRFGLS